MLRYRPASPLSSFIDQFWYARGYDSDRKRQSALPTGSVDLTFNLASRRSVGVRERGRSRRHVFRRRSRARRAIAIFRARCAPRRSCHRRSFPPGRRRRIARRECAGADRSAHRAVRHLGRTCAHAARAAARSTHARGEICLARAGIQGAAAAAALRASGHQLCPTRHADCTDGSAHRADPDLDWLQPAPLHDAVHRCGRSHAEALQPHQSPAQRRRARRARRRGRVGGPRQRIRLLRSVASDARFPRVQRRHAGRVQARSARPPRCIWSSTAKAAAEAGCRFFQYPHPGAG